MLYFNDQEGPDILLETIWLTLNRGCNNRCLWCYAKSSEFKEHLMSPSLAKKLIKISSDLGVGSISLIGGEPTLYPHLNQIIPEIKKRNLWSSLITNGRLFSNKSFTKRIVDWGLDSVCFSIKASNAEQYKKTTNSDGYYEMIEGFRNLIKTKIDVKVTVTIVKSLIPYIFELIGVWSELNTEGISFDLGSPIVWRDRVTADDIPTPLELRDICINIHNYMKNKTTPYSFHITFPLCLFPQHVKEEMITKGCIATGCQMQSGNGAIFTQNGEVLPCNHFISHSLGKLGKDFDDANQFKLFWKSKEVVNFRKSTRKYPSQKCIDCVDWDACAGGCIIKWLYWNPEQYIPGYGQSKYTSTM